MVATLLFMLIFGIIQFGWTFFEYIQVAHAANSGARWGALGSDNTTIADKARNAAPLLDPDNLTVDPDLTSDSVRVTVTYPRTELVPFFPLPDTITSSAEQRLE